MDELCQVITWELDIRKETLHKVVYSTDDEEAPCDHVYIKKATFSGTPPQTVTMTISFVE